MRAASPHVNYPGQYVYSMPRRPPTAAATGFADPRRLSGLGHRRRKWIVTATSTSERQSRLPMEPVHLADREIGGSGAVPAGPQPGGEYRLSLPARAYLKQWDGSFAWPIASHWNTVGRWVYSLQDRQTIEQVAGFEYKSCCWRIQVVQRRYLRSDRADGRGALDTSIALQLELTGLSSVGKRADSFLRTVDQRLLDPRPATPISRTRLGSCNDF